MSIFRILNAFDCFQGGLKAAIHADVIQTLTVIIVTLVVILLGTIEADGPKIVLKHNTDNGEYKRQYKYKRQTHPLTKNWPNK